MKARVAVIGLVFEAIHYTPEPNAKPVLHGHTFRVDVEAEGEIGENGMVLDFRVLREAASKVLGSWHMSVILPRGAAFNAQGEFSYQVKQLPYPHATTEYIALTLGEELRRELCKHVPNACKKLVLRIRVWESVDRYAEVEIPAALEAE